MAGRTGASQDAPVSMRPVVPTPSGSVTQEIGTSGGGNKHYSSEVALWLLPSPRHTRYWLSHSTPPRISPYWQNTANSSPKSCSNTTIPR
ncbi:ash family protein [Escherichia coli]|nr:ash family protein [Escherichia coli]